LFFFDVQLDEGKEDPKKKKSHVRDDVSSGNELGH